MVSGIELYVKLIEEHGPTQISLLALPCQDIPPEEIFDDIYKAFSEARKKIGGFLRIEGIEYEVNWPPIVEIEMKGITKKGYAATILKPEKEIKECLQELQKMGYEIA